MVAFAREIGLGQSALEVLSKCLNSFPPNIQGSCKNLFYNYTSATKAVAEKRMLKAAEELRAEQGDKDVMVSVDGTRHRRWHNSHNEVVRSVSVTTKKSSRCGSSK